VAIGLKVNAKVAIAAAVFGVLCLAAAGILAWVVLPDQARLPADTNVTRQFEGTAKLLLNPAALASGDLTKALLRDVPVTVDRTVKTLATDGAAAQVSDTRILRAKGGGDLGRAEAVYAVDRTSLEAAKSHPTGWAVGDHRGLTVSWPVGAAKKDYVGWVSDTQSTTPLRYVRTEKRGGVQTYVFEAAVAPAPIKDQQVLASLPKSLAPKVLGALATVLPVPEALKAQLGQVVPRLTTDVPLTYSYESTSTYWVEPSTGIVLDVKREEIRKVGLELPGGASVPASIPVYDVSTAAADASVKDATKDASDGRDAIRLYGTILPVGLLILGLLALLPAVITLGARLGRRRRASTAP
jgi:hypothetical protein